MSGRKVALVFFFVCMAALHLIDKMLVLWKLKNMLVSHLGNFRKNLSRFLRMYVRPLFNFANRVGEPGGQEDIL